MNNTFEFAIAVSLNNWQIDSITRHDIPGFGPRWSVRVRFHNVTSTEQAIAKLGELKADCVTQQLTVDHATIRTYHKGEPVIANLVILEPNSKSGYIR